MNGEKSRKTVGVVLLNLGGPERLADVRPFLYNLFSDRKIIRLGPAFLQRPIAHWIAGRRAPKSREAYRLIGGGSPLAKITGEQAKALATELAPFGDFRVVMAMRYWPPFAQEVLAGLARQGIRKIVALTLYPHYSVATTGSSLADLRTAAAGFRPAFRITEIASWPEQPRYIAALAEVVRAGLAAFSEGAVQVVYSAHSLPVKFIEAGDPYPDEIKRTIRALDRQTGVEGRLCFQSRSGPVRWLSPSTPDMLRELAGQGHKQVLMVPISFVSDHVETLYEIDILYRRLAVDLGMKLERTASLNVRPAFIAALKELVLEQMTEDR